MSQIILPHKPNRSIYNPNYDLNLYPKIKNTLLSSRQRVKTFFYIYLGFNIKQPNQKYMYLTI